MNWTAESETRFSELRQKELVGTLTEAEKTELAEFIALSETEEAEQLSATFAQMQAEQVAIQTKMQTLQHDNNELVRIIAQQEQLIIDAQRWLAEFGHRHKLIRQSYTQLIGEALA